MQCKEKQFYSPLPLLLNLKVFFNNELYLYCTYSLLSSGCRSMRIGKILVDSDAETHEARVIFAKFPYDIAERKVLLLYPIMNSGNKVCRAIRVCLDHKVPEEHVILINLFRSKLHIQPKKRRNFLLRFRFISSSLKRYKCV